MTCVDLTATAWRKAKMSFQSSAMVVNVLAVACFALPGSVIFLFSALMVIRLSLSFSSSALLAFYPSFAHSVMEQAKIFRSLPASDSPWEIAASVRNGRRRTALRSVQYLCFFERAKSPSAVQRRTSAIRSCILLPYAAKVISILRQIKEGELIFHAR